ncbi:MAG: DUF2795 domain-containing protein [Actinomycetota bacterium]
MSTHLAGRRSPESTQQVPVTRIEVVDHLGSAFSKTSATKSDLLTEAEQAGARGEVIELLSRLPERRFGRINELWTELQDVPIEP